MENWAAFGNQYHPPFLTRWGGRPPQGSCSWWGALSAGSSEGRPPDSGPGQEGCGGRGSASLSVLLAMLLREASQDPSDPVYPAIRTSCVCRRRMCPQPSEAQGGAPAAPRGLPSKPAWPVSAPQSTDTSFPSHTCTQASRTPRLCGPRPHVRSVLSLHSAGAHGDRTGRWSLPKGPARLCGRCTAPSSPTRPREAKCAERQL